VLIVGRADAAAMTALRGVVRSDHVIVDLARMPADGWPCRIEGLCW
jgi:hypothetical protein